MMERLPLKRGIPFGQNMDKIGMRDLVIRENLKTFKLEKLLEYNFVIGKKKFQT